MLPLLNCTLSIYTAFRFHSFFLCYKSLTFFCWFIEDWLKNQQTGIHGRQMHVPWRWYQKLLLKSMITGESLMFFTTGFYQFFFNSFVFLNSYYFKSNIRLVRFDANNWRISYKAVVVLEHLLTHGPESVAEEFQTHKDAIQEMTNFQYIDEKGYFLFLVF